MSFLGFGKDNEETPNVDSQRNDTDGKRRPTPKRKEAQKRNERPLVVDKKTARANRRKQRDRLYQKQKAALDGVGDERYLPPIDQGAVRKYVRDYVDSRYAIGEMFLPLMLVFLIISFIMQSQPYLFNYLVIALYVMILLGFLEVMWVTYMLNKQLMIVSNGEKLVKKGNGRYVLMRQISPRIMRRPKALFPRGSRPDVRNYASAIRDEIKQINRHLKR